MGSSFADPVHVLQARISGAFWCRAPRGVSWCHWSSFISTSFYPMKKSAPLTRRNPYISHQKRIPLFKSPVEQCKHFLEILLVFLCAWLSNSKMYLMKLWLWKPTCVSPSMQFQTVVMLFKNCSSYTLPFLTICLKVYFQEQNRLIRLSYIYIIFTVALKAKLSFGDFPN